MGLPGGNVVLQIGEESVIRVSNQTGDAIPNGAAVYISGLQGARPTIALADASSIMTAGVSGVTTEAIAHGDSGYITAFGLVRDVDTNG